MSLENPNNPENPNNQNERNKEMIQADFLNPSGTSVLPEYNQKEKEDLQKRRDEAEKKRFAEMLANRDDPWESIHTNLPPNRRRGK